MPRGHYKRAKRNLKEKKPPEFVDPTIPSLRAANSRLNEQAATISELRDRIAMLNRELEVVRADYLTEDAENNRFRAIIDKLLLNKA